MRTDSLHTDWTESGVRGCSTWLADACVRVGCTHAHRRMFGNLLIILFVLRLIVAPREQGYRVRPV